MQGYIAYSEIEKSACSKMLLFTIWNVFFANVLTGSITSQIQIFLDPKNIPWVLAVVVPGQVNHFLLFYSYESKPSACTMYLILHVCALY